MPQGKALKYTGVGFIPDVPATHLLSDDIDARGLNRDVLIASGVYEAVSDQAVQQARADADAHAKREAETLAKADAHARTDALRFSPFAVGAAPLPPRAPATNNEEAA